MIRRKHRGIHLSLPGGFPERACCAALARTRFHSQRTRIKALPGKVRNDIGENSFARICIMLPQEWAEAKMSVRNARPVLFFCHTA
jgi:hypothetical protein